MTCAYSFNSSANYIVAYLISQAVVPLPNCFYLFMKGSSIIVVEYHTTWVTWALLANAFNTESRDTQAGRLHRWIDFMDGV